MEFIPALSILGAFLLVVLVLIIRFKTDDLTKLLEGKNFFLIATLIAIIIRSPSVQRGGGSTAATFDETKGEK